MLVTAHLLVAFVVVASYGAAATLLWPQARQGAPVGGRAGQLLALARGSLTLQLGLGLALAAGGAVGAAAHYLAAMAAGVAAWVGFTRQRSAANPAREAALTSALVALLALAALLLGWRRP